ncbi:MAG: hypothetical protein RL207_1825 [Bacteroidota bacterium]|jgi:hypothetical protein
MKNLAIFSFLLFSFITNAQLPNYVPTNGLVGWWPFSGNSNDLSGNANDGIITGATLTNDRNGAIDAAYYFDGVDDYFDVSLDQMDSFSISIWVENISNSSTNIIWQHKNNCVRGGGYMLINNQGQLRLYTQNCGECSPGGCSNDVDLSSVSTITLNTWNHFVLTKNAQGRIMIYLNNMLVIDNTNVIQNLNYGIQTFSIGKWHDEPDLYFTHAKKDDIGFWSRVLSSCEITNLYNAQVPTSTQTQTALDSYTWPVNNQTYTQSGTYSDTLVNAAGCDSLITLNLSLEYTGVDELQEESIFISPNPITSSFTISGVEQIVSLSLKDLSGKLIKTFDIQDKNYSVSYITSGVYFLEVRDEIRTYIVKVVKE